MDIYTALRLIMKLEEFIDYSMLIDICQEDLEHFKAGITAKLPSFRLPQSLLSILKRVKLWFNCK